MLKLTCDCIPLISCCVLFSILLCLSTFGAIYSTIDLDSGCSQGNCTYANNIKLGCMITYNNIHTCKFTSEYCPINDTNICYLDPTALCPDLKCKNSKYSVGLFFSVCGLLLFTPLVIFIIYSIVKDNRSTYHKL